ncbi:HNH endonuclease [Vibrio cholerae]|nr:HNH endonuclease [Vibrio cholerae]
MATQKQKDAAWNAARPIRGKNPNLFRLDAKGNEIYKPAYGTKGSKGWEVDHKRPKSKGGSNAARNLQALQTQENRRKGKQYPY